MLNTSYHTPSVFYCRGMKAYHNSDPSWHGRYLYRGEALDDWETGYHEAMLVNNYMVKKDADYN